ncbi:hypothetical protein FVP74_11945 [Microbacterium saccharophilum]|uniref:Uncharacterized protein n=1 Tax=Microbacterium saccharophilum TaxID=1213358 RepID=A0A5C8HV74_9MICO|nr:hypothetical protein [Microbacterium saccharophilum]TXK08802.1 hypothetical protein FVP74_11945 [Microbacterium saccharophilum]GEP49174.1 hypothetical protein MSA03_26820 [Microbacterium saccharophilum]
MTREPTDREVRAYLAAERTPVIFAEGALPPRGGEMNGKRLILCTMTLEGVPRILLEDQVGSAAVEITAARVAGVRMESKPFEASAAVEVQGRADDGRVLDDDGKPQFFVISGPKRVLGRAFSSIGISL